MLFVGCSMLVVEEREKEMSEEKLPINVNHCTIFPFFPVKVLSFHALALKNWIR